jgi:3-hydroxybutyryl-CoA dehydratase
MNQISPPPAREAGDLHGFFLEDLHPGMSAAYARTVTEADVILFAGVSGDQNPVHLNQEFAEGTRFKGRIAHGMLTASFISTVLGNKLPGPGCIYVSQNLKFRAPVRIGDTVRTRVVVTSVDMERGKVALETTCSVGETVVITGDALLVVPRRPAAQAAE